MSKQTKSYYEIEQKHCHIDIRKERGERGGFEVYNPKIRANASLKSVVNHARLQADFSLRDFRIASDWCDVLRNSSQGSKANHARHQAEVLRTKWQALEEIAQHLERLT